MADDPNKRDYRDKTRINFNQEHEKQYWKKKFNISGQQLRGALDATNSTSVKKVTKYLKDKGII
ncbi:DUF3606 domain-containing protein [Mesonia sp.]|uniref:DUF3606 domain-containing protein n=1 Tax=Mesonia sp. TaxID=1960830 RepID=UPI0017629ECD|nr:DUF3606 domain-containing protein [Mesonia sp.]HIB36343.1 DUF3606 domain-containing protein [Mesonia sp.]